MIEQVFIGQFLIEVRRHPRPGIDARRELEVP
jgi:hypothetical protein